MTRASSSSSDFFVDGGAVKPTAPCYIERPADQELLESVLNGEFCYVLTPRQMGKSSLMARTASRLKEEGVHTVTIELTAIVSKESLSLDTFYLGLAHRIQRELGLQVNLKAWWDEHAHLPPVQRFDEFLRYPMLDAVPGRIAIFIDEIDATISLPFKDDFFAGLRACYNARAVDFEYERLTFVLLGVAGPADLIADARRTPFNIGRRVVLSDFTKNEAAGLAPGLGADPETSKKLLDRIHHWTGGHPYLTQRLGQLVARSKSEIAEQEDVDRLVKERFLTPKAVREEDNLKFVQSRLVEDTDHRRRLLKLYGAIEKGKQAQDDPVSVIHNRLKLSGLATPDENGQLKIRNKLYREVFNKAWIKESMPRDTTRITAAALAASILLAGLTAWYWFVLPMEYIDRLEKLTDDLGPAEEAYETLRKFPGQKERADALFAGFWSRRARAAEAKEDRDAAILMRLKTVEIHDTLEHRSAAAGLIKPDYRRLLATMHHGEDVRAAAFSPDGTKVLTVTDLWAHLHSLSAFIKQDLTASKSRLFALPLSGGVRFVDGHPDQAQVVLGANSVPIKATTIDFDTYAETPIEGDPDELLKTWLDRLALTFDNKGYPVPKYPISVPLSEKGRSGLEAKSGGD